MNDEKLIPKLRFSGFIDGWRNVDLGDVTDITKLAGFEFTKYVNYEDSGKIIALRAINVKNNKLNLSDVKYIDNSDFSKLNRSKLYSGDLLLTYIGANIGDVALVPEDDKFYLAPNICRIHSNMEINPIFLKNYFNTNIMINEIKKYINASSQPALLMNNIRKFKFKFPNLIEQNKIAHFFSCIDKKIELLENKSEFYQDFKKYLMQQIFAQKLRFNFTDEWEEYSFKELLKEINEKTTINNQHEILSSTKDGIFTQKDYFADRNVASKDNTGYKILRKDQIVLSPQNLWMGNINVNTEFEIGIVSPSYKIYETTDLIEIDYLKHVIKLPRLIHEYKCASEQGASIVRRNLNKLLFNEIKIKVPSLKEQQKIGNILNLIDKKISETLKQIDETKEFKKGLLQQMFI